MKSTLEYPPVTQETLDEVVRRILSVGAPLKVVLFGSRARGEVRLDSDLDLDACCSLAAKRPIIFS
jgi:predicted nucleotidyltransferase